MGLKTIVWAVCLLAARGRVQAAAADLVIDFRDGAQVAHCRPEHDVAALRASAEGMEIHIAGPDPFITGPAVELSAAAPAAHYLLELKLKSEQGGMVEVFYFPAGGHAAAGRSVTARVAPGDWQVVRMALPALEPRTGFRIDPPGTGGTAVIASMTLRPRLKVPESAWPQQGPVAKAGNPALTVVSDELTFVHDGQGPGGFRLSVGGEAMAIGMNRSLVGYVLDGVPRWTELPTTADVRADAGAALESSTWRDADSATWRLERRYAKGKPPGSIDVETRIGVDRDRDVVFFPALVLLPGAGSYGADKTQAVFAGLEYLDAPDASSSELDVTGPASRRRVPASQRVTFPLMAVCAKGRYVGLVWERSASCSPLFDSPDRTFNAGGHVMGLVFPGSDARTPGDGDLLPGETQTIKAMVPLVVRATILGGTGTSIVPAIEQYVALRPLPEVPKTGLDAEGYRHLAAGGWLDSKLREGDKVRHAVWPGFGAGVAADAAVWMRWLAAGTGDVALAGRLRDAAAEVIGAVPGEQYDTAHVAHVTYPALASLVFGHVEENAAAAAARGRALLARFEPDGTVRYRADRGSGKLDFGKTHFAPDANGLTASLVVQVLRCAAVSGDAKLLKEGLRLLRGLDKFRDTVPRGAQTWEVPLHTPDILASAHLVRAYVLGYEMTGEQTFLDQARYWAWTGVPFIYLDDPTGRPVGTYATVPVFGASSWIDVWFGRPVQWCGLVYADALYDLRRHDPAGPWRRIADGITASGIQQSWPATDHRRQGLLPDFYHLADQVRDGPAINPGTLQACAARLFGGPGAYAFHRFPDHGVIVHAPGPIPMPTEDDHAVRFTAEGWPEGTYFVLVSGLTGPPIVHIDGRRVDPGDQWTFSKGTGRLVLRVRGKPKVELELR